MSPMEVLQREVFQRLDADAYFADIPLTIMLPRSGETALLTGRYKQALAGQLVKAGKYGVAVFIELPDALVKDETPGPRFDAEVQLTIIERPEVNHLTTGTGKSGNEVAVRIAQHLSLQGVMGLNDDLAMGTFTGVKIVNPLETESPQITGVVASIDVQPRPLSRCGRVALSDTALSVTLTTSTSGAAIYYTTDGSFPYNGNGSLYAAPFAVDSGTTVRAVAHKTGLSASPVTFKRVT